MILTELINYCHSHEKLYIYGAGMYGRIIRTYLAEQAIELTGFIVSSKKEGKQSVLELPVLSIDDFMGLLSPNTGVIVGVSKQFQQEIVSVLKENDICDYYCVDDARLKQIEQGTCYSHRYCSSNDITVFCYHRVTDISLDTWKLAVKPELFEEQIKYIKDNYTVLRSEEDWSRANGERAAIITFDDGYEDIYTTALPILEKHSIPATVFVCTGNIDSANEFWWDELERVVFFADKEIEEINTLGLNLRIITDEDKEKACYYLHPYLKRMYHEDRKCYIQSLARYLRCTSVRDYCHSMKSNQLRKLANSEMITVGGHTVTHSCLAYESAELQEYEIKHSKEVIERIIGRKIDVFSYPFGQREDFTECTIDIAKKNGYKKIFAAYEGISNPNYKNGYIPRVNIGQERDLAGSIKLLTYYETVYGN